MRRWFRRDTDSSDPEGRVDQVLATHQTEIAERLESSVQDLLHSVTRITEELRGQLDRDRPRLETDTVSLDAQSAELLRKRMVGMQQYLASVLDYEAERDQAISDWVGHAFVQGQQVLKEEAGRVIGELGAGIDEVSVATVNEILSHLDEQTRAISYDLSVQEARIRLSMTEGQESHAEILTKQLRVLESIETDLTTELDERLARLAELTGTAAAWTVEEVADRVGERSTEAVTMGMKDVLAVIDRRFAWLEETIQSRLAGLERALGVETELTVIPDSETVVSIDDALESARFGGPADR